jgi:CHAD domain-containing protein
MPQPVTTFLRHSLALRAAMAECLADPTPKAVHSLRSSTRRIEATLQLLVDTADLPALPKRSKRFSKSLRKIRRTAGSVRDLDVHSELLATYKTISDADSLQEELNSAREDKVKKLQQQILKDQRDIHRSLGKIETVLALAADLNLSGGSLARLAQTALAPALHGLDPKEDDDLHSIRKACKTARYIAEIGSEASKVTSGLAKRFNKIQQTIGAWHDYHMLLNEAHSALPNDSPLAAKLRAKTRILRHQAESKAGLLIKKASKSPSRTSDVH